MFYEASIKQNLNAAFFLNQVIPPNFSCVGIDDWHEQKKIYCVFVLEANVKMYTDE